MPSRLQSTRKGIGHWRKIIVMSHAYIFSAKQRNVSSLARYIDPTNLNMLVIPAPVTHDLRVGRQSVAEHHFQPAITHCKSHTCVSFVQLKYQAFFSLSPPPTIGLPGICPLHSLSGPIQHIWARLFYFVMHMKSCLLNKERQQFHSENIIILLSDISILECSDFTQNIHVFLCSQSSITLQMVLQ